MFRSKNWDHLKSLNIKSRVLYTNSDLELLRSNHPLASGTVYDSPTTVVAIENDGVFYVGVAQCGPRDEYNRGLGREIAAGRALKQLARHTANPDLAPSDIWTNSGNAERAIIYGDIPSGFYDERLDRLFFGRNAE